jgi:hypothetical protein
MPTVDNRPWQWAGPRREWYYLLVCRLSARRVARRRASSVRCLMFVRFVILKRDGESGSQLGIFQAAMQLRNSGALAPHEVEWLERDLGWLRMHLKSPACLREPGNRRAICWFHPRAVRPIEEARGIAALLQEHGLFVRTLTTSDPGIVMYEDGFQVVAKPRRRHLTKHSIGPVPQRSS